MGEAARNEDNVTTIVESPVISLRRRQAEIEADATNALNALRAKIAALAAEADDMSTLTNYDPRMRVALRQFAVNSQTSADLIESLTPAAKKAGS